MNVGICVCTQINNHTNIIWQESGTDAINWSSEEGCQLVLEGRLDNIVGKNGEFLAGQRCKDLK